MSKQSEAKERQGYEAKPFVKMCSNCGNFQLDTKREESGWVHETNLRCNLGGFAVKKTALCNEWKPKP